MEEEPRWVRVFLRNGTAYTYPDAAYHVDVRARRLTVYRLEGEACDVLARFDLEVVRYYEYFIEA